MPKPTSLPERVIGFIEAASTIAEKAATADARQASVKAACADLIPGIVDLLATINVVPAEKRAADGHEAAPVPLLPAEDRAAVAEALGDPVQALNILHKVAGHLRRATAADSLGRPLKKQANADPGPYTGRRTSQQSAAWDILGERIMSMGSGRS